MSEKRSLFSADPPLRFHQTNITHHRQTTIAPSCTIQHTREAQILVTMILVSCFSKVAWPLILLLLLVSLMSQSDAFAPSTTHCHGCSYHYHDAASIQHKNPATQKSITRLFSTPANFNDPLAPSTSSTSTTPSTRKKPALKPFERYLEVECWKHADLRELEPVVRAVANACKQINRLVQRAQTDDIYGAAVDAQGQVLEENIQGEVQQKLDVLCNDLLLRAFCGASQGQIHAVASEEEDTPRCCSSVMNDNAFAVGEFVVSSKDDQQQ